MIVTEATKYELKLLIAHIETFNFKQAQNGNYIIGGDGQIDTQILQNIFIQKKIVLKATLDS